jgi:hypothetical protein
MSALCHHLTAIQVSEALLRSLPNSLICSLCLGRSMWEGVILGCISWRQACWR